MIIAVILSRSSIYKGDYDCLFRTPQNEMKTELHYHDFYEIVLYLGNAGIFTINGQEYLMKRERNFASINNTSFVIN